ncbi:hypothetical protein EJB05_44561 [Eragrostis curvula]|uniref:Uncharacterized protein n=1 Tax=Eragrostis curvula TaxID=38414 RepID=A0A5J9TI09_9POAL|nr:hypothetical protein EJB05_44561 [Eragrostis curvula]
MYGKIDADQQGQKKPTTPLDVSQGHQQAEKLKGRQKEEKAKSGVGMGGWDDGSADAGGRCECPGGGGQPASHFRCVCPEEED